MSNKYVIGGTYRNINGRIVRTNVPRARAIAIALPQARSRTTGRFIPAGIRAFFSRLWRYTKITITLLALLSFAAFIGYAIHGNTITATNNLTITTPAPSPAPSFPVLDRIARAESHNSQLCTPSLVHSSMCHSYEIGAPLIHANANGSYDIGMYQINSTHLSDAIANGFDVYTEAGNRAYAEYLFTTQGSEPWSASKANW